MVRRRHIGGRALITTLTARRRRENNSDTLPVPVSEGSHHRSCPPVYLCSRDIAKRLAQWLVTTIDQHDMAFLREDTLGAEPVGERRRGAGGV